MNFRTRKLAICTSALPNVLPCLLLSLSHVLLCTSCCAVRLIESSPLSRRWCRYCCSMLITTIGPLLNVGLLLLLFVYTPSLLGMVRGAASWVLLSGLLPRLPLALFGLITTWYASPLQLHTACLTPNSILLLSSWPHRYSVIAALSFFVACFVVLPDLRITTLLTCSSLQRTSESQLPCGTSVPVHSSSATLPITWLGNLLWLVNSSTIEEPLLQDILLLAVG